MTKAEALAKIKEAMKENVLNVTNAEQTVANIEGKEVDDVKAAEGMPAAEPVNASEVEKYTNSAEPTLVPADEDGVSKNGGEKDVIDNEKIEAERKKEDNAMKDVINVTDRTYEENKEVQNELVAQLQEAVEKNEKLKVEMKNIQDVCKAALEAQKSQYVEYSTKKVEALIESIVKIGESMEAELNAEIERGKKNLVRVEATLKASNKLNNILREGLLASREPKKMVRYESVMKRYSKIAA